MPSKPKRTKAQEKAQAKSQDFEHSRNGLREALLGLLAIRPMSGYDLTRSYERALQQIWYAPLKQIYPTLRKMQGDGLLKVVCDYPDIAGLEDWLVTIQSIIGEFKPQRVALDSLSALERIGTVNAFREFVIGMTSFIKQQEITGLFTATTSSLMPAMWRPPGRANPIRSGYRALPECPRDGRSRLPFRPFL